MTSFTHSVHVLLYRFKYASVADTDELLTTCKPMYAINESNWIKRFKSPRISDRNIADKPQTGYVRSGVYQSCVKDWSSLYIFLYIIYTHQISLPVTCFVQFKDLYNGQPENSDWPSLLSSLSRPLPHPGRLHCPVRPAGSLFIFHTTLTEFNCLPCVLSLDSWDGRWCWLASVIKKNPKHIIRKSCLLWT